MGANQLDSGNAPGPGGSERLVIRAWTKRHAELPHAADTPDQWCIAYHYHQARTFWTFSPSGFEYCTDPDQLAVRLETARHLFGLIGGQLSR